jgi:hypothetical protein
MLVCKPTVTSTGWSLVLWFFVSGCHFTFYHFVFFLLHDTRQKEPKYERKGKEGRVTKLNFIKEMGKKKRQPPPNGASVSNVPDDRPPGIVPLKAAGAIGKKRRKRKHPTKGTFLVPLPCSFPCSFPYAFLVPLLALPSNSPTTFVSPTFFLHAHQPFCRGFCQARIMMMPISGKPCL